MNNILEIIFIVFQIVWYNFLGLLSLYRGSITTNGVYQSAAIHGIVCFINAFCRILEFIKINKLYINNSSINYLRYTEWTICTPLMILEITLASRFSAAQTLPLIVLSVAFCLSGSIAALTRIMWLKIILGVKGTFYCVIVIFRLWKIILNKRNIFVSKKEYEVSLINLMFASLLYPVFIVTWALGPDIYHVINIRHELLIENISSLTLKTCALSFALISTSERLEKIIEIITSFI